MLLSASFLTLVRHFADMWRTCKALFVSRRYFYAWWTINRLCESCVFPWSSGGSHPVLASPCGSAPTRPPGGSGCAVAAGARVSHAPGAESGPPSPTRLYRPSARQQHYLMHVRTHIDFEIQAGTSGDSKIATGMAPFQYNVAAQVVK